LFNVKKEGFFSLSRTERTEEKKGHSLKKTREKNIGPLLHRKQTFFSREKREKIPPGKRPTLHGFRRVLEEAGGAKGKKATKESDHHTTMLCMEMAQEENVV